MRPIVVRRLAECRRSHPRPPTAAERWAADLGIPAYAIDEQTAIKVVDGSVEVISEGQWTPFGVTAAEQS